MDRLDRMLALVRSHVPGLRLVNKQRVPWMRALGVLARPVVPEFETRFTTVIGNTVYLPRPVDEIPRDALAATLAHELVHQLDQQRYHLGFYASYGLAFPAFRTARAAWERRAYAVDMLIAYDRAGERGLSRCVDRLVDVFAGPSYAWMWAGSGAARTYLEPVAAGVRDGSLAQEEPYRAILHAWRGQEAPPS
jgi:hypothetical protein